MKKLVGFLAVLSMFAVVPLLAQHGSRGGGGGSHGVGGGHIPAHGPAPAKGEYHEAPQKPRAFNDRAGHPTLPTFTPTTSGSAMIPAEMIRTTTSIIPGNMDVLRAASAVAMSSGSREETGSASGSVASTSASLPTIMTFVMTGFGTLTRF